MKNLIGIMLLLMVSMTVSAQEVVVEISDFTGGTVSVKEKKGQDVTITVAPDKNYFIEMKDVTVIAVKDPASFTRSDDVTIPVGGALKLTLVDDEGAPVVDEKGDPVTDPEDKTQARNYQFTVPEGLGAWVTEADFHEVDKPITSGKLTESVSWEVATDETTATKTLILSGDGVAGLDSKGEVTYPWKDFDDAITDIVVEEGIEAIGDGILDNCTALQSITLKGQKMVGLGKNTLTDKVSVDVYGRLYNEYKTTEGWSDAEITSSDGEEMTGVAFGEGNSYDVFYSEKAMYVPSVLLAFTVSAIDGSNVKIEEIKDGIIPANVAVLLFSEKIDDDDFRTTPSDEKGETTSSQLVPVTKEEGKEVTLGEVYLLYNDVFYLSQAGTIPQGGVYLPKPVLKTRSFLTIGTDDDNTTAIESSKLKAQSTKSKDGWFDLRGRRLNGVPTTKGVYINNGRKMIIR